MKQMRVALRKKFDRHGTNDWRAPGLRLCIMDMRQVFGKELDEVNEVILVIGSHPRKGAQKIHISTWLSKGLHLHVRSCRYMIWYGERMQDRYMYSSVGRWLHRNVQALTERSQVTTLYVSVEIP